MAKVLKSELFAEIPSVDEKFFHDELKAALKNFNKKIVVLDDDPTGVQTVNGISVYTDWTEESIAAGFAEENSMFFILTNSRAFSEEKTRAEHKKIAERVSAAATLIKFLRGLQTSPTSTRLSSTRLIMSTWKFSRLR